MAHAPLPSLVNVFDIAEASSSNQTDEDQTPKPFNKKVAGILVGVLSGLVMTAVYSATRSPNTLSTSLPDAAHLVNLDETAFRQVQSDMSCACGASAYPVNTGTAQKGKSTVEDCGDYTSSLGYHFFTFQESNSKCIAYESCDGLQAKGGMNLYTNNPEPPAPEDSSWTGVTTKQGLGALPAAAPTGRCTDAAVLGMEDSWYYTWSTQESKSWSCYNSGQYFGKEFVPIMQDCSVPDQVWDSDNNVVKEPYATNWKNLNARYLLGYNEPDGTGVPGQTCSASLAAEKWVIVQKIANFFDPPLILVSPAPVSGCMNKNLGPDYPQDECGQGFAMGNSPWLNDFFKECDSTDGCDKDLIKYIALHDYEGAVQPLVSNEEWPDNLQTRIENIPKNYDGRKVWVSEVDVGCGLTSVCRSKKVQNTETKEIYRDGQSGYPGSLESALQYADQDKYAKAALPFLESSDDVFRYAWFSLRKKPVTFNGYSALIPYEDVDVPPQPSEIGETAMDTGRRMTVV